MSQAEDTGVGGIDEPQPNALAAPHRERIGDFAIDGPGVADATIVSHVMHVAEIIDDLRIVGQSPIRKDPYDVAIDVDRLPFVDNERA
jgi:hypothetical protein